MDTKPTVERLRAALTYDPATGILRWRETLGSRAKSGDLAGTKATRGHLVVRVDGRLLMAHQAAWAIATGEWPTALLQHVNGNFADNRLVNLRLVTKREVHADARADALTPENVHAVFRYRAGRLYWRDTLSGKHRVAGREAGGVGTNGYVVVEVGGKAYPAHRVVWLMHRGEWPAGEIDHMNGQRTDNRIANLRDVGHRTNAENRRTATRGSNTGHLGVTPHQSGRFRARIRVEGRLVSLGLYDTPDMAHEAYVAAKRSLHAGNTL